ncbi:MAG: glutathione peroxidase [Kutzneria sp.]|nr:glutathione peroxidase [Kutzneria sp.]
MGILDVGLRTLAGTPTTLADLKAKALLIVNVASRCGLTPQYAGLERVQERYSDRGLAVVGFPCNQFMGQEPGTNEEIRTFCSTTYGISFPMMDKLEVNGENRHPLYAELVAAADAEGTAGDVQWNFEKFLVTAGGAVAARFRPKVEPEDPALLAAIEKELAG